VKRFTTEGTGSTEEEAWVAEGGRVL